MVKQQRTYSLLIETTINTGQFLEVDPPFTIEFDISRPLLSLASTMHLRIYNLSESKRNSIYKDPLDFTHIRSVQLRAGYNPTLSPPPNTPAAFFAHQKAIPQLATIFTGNVTSCRSVREGENNVTTIEAQDGGFAIANAYTSQQFPANTQMQDMLFDIATDMEDLGVTVGGIGSYPQRIQRANTVEGRTSDILSNLSNNGFFIDNTKVYCIGDSETLDGSFLAIDSAMGLLGTPVADQSQYRFDMIFEPRLTLGQKILLNSTTDKHFNGQYKVVSIHHRGTISEAVSGDAVTTVGLWKGRDILHGGRLLGDG